MHSLSKLQWNLEVLRLVAKINLNITILLIIQRTRCLWQLCLFFLEGKLCPGNNTCSDNGVCDSELGSCSCNTGYYGDGCESNFNNRF